MKLVKIDEDLYLNPEFVSSIEPNDDSSSIITMNNNDVFPANIPIKKVRDTICGNEERSVIYDDTKIPNLTDIDTTKEPYITIKGGKKFRQPIKKIIDVINGDEEQSTEKSYSGVSKDGSVMNVITSNECATVALESNNECMGWKLNRKKVSKKK